MCVEAQTTSEILWSHRSHALPARPQEGTRILQRDLKPTEVQHSRMEIVLNGDQAAQDADCYGFCPASGAELGENGTDMEFNGVFRDVEPSSHLLISVPKSN
jgi:hypothetical protein